MKGIPGRAEYQCMTRCIATLKLIQFYSMEIVAEVFLYSCVSVCVVNSACTLVNVVVQKRSTLAV